MMKIKKISRILGLTGLIGMLIINSIVWAANEATVTATVTVQNISLSVTDGVVTYGTIASNTSKSTCTSELNDLQIITNDGNVAENFNIKGQNSANWTLAATNGNNQYVHEFTTSTCSNWSGGTALTTSYQTAVTNVQPNATSTLNLRITTPNPSTVFTEQSVDVFLQAVAS